MEFLQGKRSCADWVSVIFSSPLSMRRIIVYLFLQIQILIVLLSIARTVEVQSLASFDFFRRLNDIWNFLQHF